MTEHSDLLFAKYCADDAPGKRQQLVEKYHDCVRRTVASVIGRQNGNKDAQGMIDDVTQDVFVSLLENDCKKLRTFQAKKGCSLKTWLCTVAARRTINELRRAALRDTLQSSDAQIPHFPDTRCADKDLLNSEIAAFFQSALSTFSNKDRLVFRLIFEDSIGYREAAVVCRMTKGALYTRVSRIKAALYDMAKKDGFL
jgi:RNA polymerase sigma factor (sigma-70 family)